MKKRETTILYTRRTTPSASWRCGGRRACTPRARWIPLRMPLGCHPLTRAPCLSLGKQPGRVARTRARTVRTGVAWWRQRMVQLCIMCAWWVGKNWAWR